MRNRHIRNDGNNGSEEKHAGDNCAEAKTTILHRLGKQIAEGSSKRACKNIRQPEGENAINLKHVIGKGNGGNNCAKEKAGSEIAEIKMLGDEIAGRRSQRKCKEYG